MEPSPRQSLPGKPLQRSAASQRRFHAHVATIEARHRLTDPVQSPSAPVAIVSASSSANYLHEWSDGSKHRLPEDFQYDNMGCDALWIKWFHGAPKRRIGPYRHFTVDDVKGALNCKYMMRARRVMAELTSIAVATGLAASEDAIAQLRPPECQNVFNAAFAHLEIRQAVGECAKPVRRSSTCKTFIALDQRDRMTRTFEWADGTALHSVPEHWTLPNWSCLNIWLAWFLGDPQSGVRPFRHLYILPNQQQQLHLTRQVMAKLVQIALGMQLAASEVDISKLSKWNIQRVYLEAFDILAQRHVPPAECSNINAKKVKVSTLHAILQANNAFCSR
ncbi:hypothetical protein DYB25_009009 [Aphanomyces astaci]|uniref:Uncharacterized protein n=1 Tax=Aphanomyces astaci TaxID=112090 RepID=A0A396ZT39_APHAT|nr:hypothetical protein DYB25_009009 [Aphanomyces astaci]